MGDVLYIDDRSGPPGWPSALSVKPRGRTMSGLLVIEGADGREVQLKPDRLHRRRLIDLFAGEVAELRRYFPAPAGATFDEMRVAEALIYACHDRGVRGPARNG